MTHNGKVLNRRARDTQVVWKLGDPWCDLRPFLPRMGAVTVVTESATAHVVDVVGGWRRRVPLVGGRALPEDTDPVALGDVAVATPCGVRFEDLEPPAQHETTRVVLVLRGVYDDRVDSDITREALELLGRRGWRRPPGHPRGPCGALYCPRATTR